MEKRSLEWYLNNFNEVYQEHDRLINHETNLDELTLVIDCHINCEDVTVGLALQIYTPFRFLIRKVWCSYGLQDNEYSFKSYNILSFINPNVILIKFFVFFFSFKLFFISLKKV